MNVTLNLVRGDQNPFPAPGGFEYVFGVGQIFNSAWRVAETPEGQCAMWPIFFNPVSSGILRIRTRFDTLTFSHAGAFFGTSDGDGYQLTVSSNAVRCFRTIGGYIGPQVGTDATPPTYVEGDHFEFFMDCDTGDLWIDYEGETIFSVNDTTTTENIKAGIFSRAGSIAEAIFYDPVPEIISVNDNDNVLANSINNTLVLTEYFIPESAYITDGTTNLPLIITDSNSPNFVFSVTEVNDEDLTPLFGQADLVVERGDLQAFYQINYLPETGYTYINLVGPFEDSPNTIGNNFTPALQTGDQIVYPVENVYITSDAKGYTEGNIDLPLYHVSSTDYALRTFNLVTGQAPYEYLQDFSSLPNANPWAKPADIDFIRGSFQIISGTLRPTYGTDGISFLRYNNAASSGVLKVHVAQNHDQTLYSDCSCPAILDENGNGYVLQINGVEVRLRLTNNFTLSTTTAILSVNTDYEIGSIFTLERDLNSAAGTMRVLLNGSLLGTVEDNTYTENLAQGFVGLWGNINLSGAQFIAFDGLNTQTIEVTFPDIIEEGTPQIISGVGFNDAKGSGSIVLRDKVNIVNSRELVTGVWSSTNIETLISTGWLEKLMTGVSSPVYGLPFTSPNYELEIVVENSDGEIASRDLVVNPLAGWVLLETTIANANTTEGESVLAYATIQDNMQWLAPNSVLAQDGVTTVNFTWNSNGTFTCDSPEMVQLNILAFDVVTYEISMQPLLIGFNQVMPLTITGPDSVTEGQPFTVTFTN